MVRAATTRPHRYPPLGVSQMVQVILRHVDRPGTQAKLSGINFDTAMARCGGDECLLKQVMEEFSRQFSGEPEVMAHHLSGRRTVARIRIAEYLRACPAANNLASGD